MKNFTCIFFLSLFVVLPVVAECDLLIVVNPGIKDVSLTKEDIKKIYLGKKVQWDDKSKINVAAIESSEIHKLFLDQYVGRSDKQFKRYWNKIVFSGSGVPPVSFETTEELVKYVASTEGAIGYVDKKTAIANVKVINEE